MATQQALHGQRRAAPRAMPFDGLQCVIRTGRIETAGSAEKGTEEELIRANEEEQQPRAQCFARGDPPSALASSAVNSCSMTVNGAVATELRG